MAEYISFQPSDYFNTTLYTGTGASNALTGVGFQPDFCWFKNRGTTNWYNLYDAVRGTTEAIASNDTQAESTRANGLTTFGSDGFTLGDDANVNANTNTYVSWNWKAGTTSGIAGSPSITPTGYSFNATAGFSIIAYTGNGTSGATLPHGLGVAPKMIIVKNLDAANCWPVYHEIMGATKYLYLDTTESASTATSRWNDTEPDATLFTIGNNSTVNTSGEEYIAYCFADVKGYQKMGGYTGNGNADGPFVYTGFRPAFVLIKIWNSGDPKNWAIMDNKRLGYNEDNNSLYINNAAEATSDTIDILSNGFKLRRTDDTLNGPTTLKYIWYAVAEFPIVSSNDIPVTAR